PALGREELDEHGLQVRVHRLPRSRGALHGQLPGVEQVALVRFALVVLDGFVATRRRRAHGRALRERHLGQLAEEHLGALAVVGPAVAVAAGVAGMPESAASRPRFSSGRCAPRGGGAAAVAAGGRGAGGAKARRRGATGGGGGGAAPPCGPAAAPASAFETSEAPTAPAAPPSGPPSAVPIAGRTIGAAT